VGGGTNGCRQEMRIVCNLKNNVVLAKDAWCLCKNTANMTCNHLESEDMHVVGLIYSIVVLAYINIYKLLLIL